MNHIRYMKRALELAEMGKHRVSPNPAVGAVIVKDDTIIGEGYHLGPGTLHAEIAAIESSSVSVSGSTLYTTLEPCCSTYPGKRQPPCTQRIIDEKIEAVYISIKDPNRHVSGSGIDLLEKSGIKVSEGLLKEESLRQNKVYIKNIQKSLPYIHLKIAQTIDGKIATSSGDSKWITDEDARADVHKLRSEHDAVLIGSNTAKLDDPLLTVRYGLMKSIKRIVLNGSMDLPENLHLLKDQKENPTIICIDKKKCRDNSPGRFKLSENQGVTILENECDSAGRIDLVSLLEELFKLGIYSVLIEGGSSIFTSFIKQNLFDEITFYIAPGICGTGKSAVGDLGITSMSDVMKLKRADIRTINGQIILNGFRY